MCAALAASSGALAARPALRTAAFSIASLFASKCSAAQVLAQGVGVPFSSLPSQQSQMKSFTLEDGMRLPSWPTFRQKKPAEPSGATPLQAAVPGSSLPSSQSQ